MSIRLRRKRRRRSDAFAERFAPSPLESAPQEAPPMMWLPPLRPVLPEGAPVGVSLGAFKPQRDIEHAFWPGPPGEVVGEWAPWVEDEPASQPRRRRLAAAIVGLLGGMAVAAAMGIIAAGAPHDAAAPEQPTVAANASVPRAAAVVSAAATTTPTSAHRSRSDATMHADAATLPARPVELPPVR